MLGGCWWSELLRGCRLNFQKKARSKHRLFLLIGTENLPRLLIPFIEKSLLCTFLSSDLADEMNVFHQHVLKNVVACMLGNDVGNCSFATVREVA